MGQRYESELSDRDSDHHDPPVEDPDIDPELQATVEDFIDDTTDPDPTATSHPDAPSSTPPAQPPESPRPDAPPENTHTQPDTLEGPTTFEEYDPPDTTDPPPDLDGPECYTTETFTTAEAGRTTKPDPTPSITPNTGPDRRGVSDRQTQPVITPEGDEPPGQAADDPATLGMDNLANDERMRRQEHRVENPTGDPLLAADASYQTRPEAPDADQDIPIADRTIGDLIDDDVTRRLHEPSHVDSDRDRMDVAGDTIPRPVGATLAQQERTEARKTAIHERRDEVSRELDQWGPMKAAKRREHRSQLHRDTLDVGATSWDPGATLREFIASPDPMLTESLRGGYPDDGDTFDDTVDYVATRTDVSHEMARVAVTKSLVYHPAHETVTAGWTGYASSDSRGAVATVDGTITEMTDDLREARNAAIARLDPYDAGGLKPEAALWRTQQDPVGETTGTVIGRIKAVEHDPRGDGLEKVAYIEPETAPRSMPDVKLGVYRSHNVKEDATPGPHQTHDVKEAFEPVEGAVIEVAGTIHRYEDYEDERINAEAQPVLNLTKGSWYEILDQGEARPEGTDSSPGQTAQNLTALGWGDRSNADADKAQHRDRDDAGRDDAIQINRYNGDLDMTLGEPVDTLLNLL